MTPKNRLIVSAFLLMTGCGATMSTYYNAVATAASTVSTGYRLLDEKDKEIQAAVVAKAKAGNPDGAKEDLNKNLAKYDKARKALDACSFAVETARNTAPAVESAANKETQIKTWIAKLGTLLLDITVSLSEIGVKL